MVTTDTSKLPFLDEFLVECISVDEASTHTPYRIRQLVSLLLSLLSRVSTAAGLIGLVDLCQIPRASRDDANFHAGPRCQAVSGSVLI